MFLISQTYIQVVNFFGADREQLIALPLDANALLLSYSEWMMSMFFCPHRKSNLKVLPIALGLMGNLENLIACEEMANA